MKIGAKKFSFWRIILFEMARKQKNLCAMFFWHVGQLFSHARPLRRGNLGLLSLFRHRSIPFFLLPLYIILTFATELLICC
ncbi:hypothetical protein, partial [Porphyromonas loveana]|uniref:hypothetical protein n=1 Tax=Porphyromonas loveana TaxID=1884669 RepID=UPI00359FD537